MPMYVKKPIPIHAEQMPHAFYVDTKEGRMYGKPGDYLATGVEGERYPIDREIFEKTYDPVCPHGEYGGRCVPPRDKTICTVCNPKR